MRVGARTPEHLQCHRHAAKRFREELATHPQLAWKLALRREEYRLEALVKERTALQLRLDAVEEEAMLIGVRMRALDNTRPTDSEFVNCMEAVV